MSSSQPDEFQEQDIKVQGFGHKREQESGGAMMGEVQELELGQKVGSCFLKVL